jgi:hypothetical protein
MTAAGRRIEVQIVGLTSTLISILQGTSSQGVVSVAMDSESIVHYGQCTWRIAQPRPVIVLNTGLRVFDANILMIIERAKAGE